MDQAVLELSAPGPGLAVVATGGYGRSQLCCFSDIDLMLVVAEPVDAPPPVFRALWDSGLAVGHSIRTPREAVAAAQERIETQCSFLNARFIGGDEDLFEALRGRLARAVSRSQLSKRLADEEQGRRDREPHHLQAVNVKTGRGGLRTVQAIGWLAELDLLAGVDGDAARQCEARLLRARQALHIAAGRAYDVVDFSVRESAAAVAGVDTSSWLTELYAAMRAVDRLATHILALTERPAAESRSGARLFHAVRSRAGRPTELSRNPWTIAAAAVARDPEQPQLRPAEEEALRDRPSEIWNEESRAAFVQLAGGGAAARRMFDQLSDAGFLADAFPEWQRIVSQPQLDPFHLHPVDDHLWRTASVVRTLAGPDSDDDWARDIAEELGSLDEVVLGALFHDIGKGTGRDHSVAGSEIARVFGQRAGFDAFTVDIVALLVREHLLLPRVATRHDLDDPDVVRGVAERLGDVDVARMLYLLTVADAQATGPDVWTAWRAQLIRTLFARAMDVLERRRPRPSVVRTARVAELNERLSDEIPADRISAHMSAMPDTYALRTSASEVRRHLMLVDPEPVVDEVRLDVVDATEWSDVVLVTRDRPGLLLVAAGVFALANVSILEARLATRDDGVVIDRFNVEDSRVGGTVDAARWFDVVADLRAALIGSLDVDARLVAKHRHYRSLVDASVEPEVRVMAGADHGTHRIELRGADRVGLLHDVAAVLYASGVDVRYAKVDTQGGRATDTFHVDMHEEIDVELLRSHLAGAAVVP